LRALHRWIVVSGSTAVIVPGGSGLVWLIAGRPAARPMLATAIALAIITVMLTAASVMYDARQKTRRKEIERRAADTLAAALARCIDDAHVRAQDLPAAREVEEAQRVRASAAQIMADMSPVILALLGQSPGQGGSRPPRG
jgi:hypothetical protein